MKSQRSCLRITFLTVFLSLLCFAGAQALAVSGVYPPEPFDGIQSVSYTISGVTSTSYKDPKIQGMAQTQRIYSGILGTGVFRVQGTVTATADLRSAYLKVYVGFGAGGPSYSKEFEAHFGQEGQSFDVSMPIPAELDYAIKTFGADFSIFVNVLEYHDKVWGLEDGGTFTIGGHFDASSTPSANHAPTVSLNYTPAQPTVGNPIIFTATANDQDGDTLSYAWYLDGTLQNEAKSTTVNWSQPSIGAHALKVVVSDGKGGEAEATASFTVTNPGAEPYVIAPGYQEGEGEAWGFVDKVIINGQEVAGTPQTRLYTGSRVKTGPGVEIILRTAYGAVTRVKENSTYEVTLRKLATTGTIDVVGRLKDGVGEFYWPKGYAGAEKFEVDTNRIVVGIKGTTFSVSQLNDVSTVSVQEGVVEVTNLDTGAVSQVAAGGSLTAADTGGYVNGAYNYYVPYYSSSNGNWTGLGLANDNPAAKSLVQISVYDRAGNPLASEKKLIAVAGQEALPVAAGKNATGWMLVNSHEPLSGLAFIGFNGAKTLMADIPFVAELSTDLIIPHVAQDTTWDTSILLCNPHNFSNEVYFELVNEAGYSQGIDSVKLPAMGSGEYPLAAMFAKATQKKGKILITSFDGGVAAFALYNDLKSGGSHFAGINAVDEESALRFATPTFSYYLPYFSSKNGDWTGLALANSDMIGPDPAETRITVTNESGTLQAGSSVPIPIWGQFSLPLSPPTVNRGWIQVDADTPLSGLAFIGTGGTPSLMADIPFVENLSRKLVVPHVAQDSIWDTTLLLCNPAAQAASVQIVNHDQLGESGGTANRIIAARGSARYELSTLFAGHPEVSGKIEITSSTGLAGFALYSNKKSGGSYFAGINAEAVE